MKEVTDTAVIGQYEMVEETAELMWKGLKARSKDKCNYQQPFRGQCPDDRPTRSKKILSLKFNLS